MTESTMISKMYAAACFLPITLMSTIMLGRLSALPVRKSVSAGPTPAQKKTLSHASILSRTIFPPNSLVLVPTRIVGQNMNSTLVTGL